MRDTVSSKILKCAPQNNVISRKWKQKIVQCSSDVCNLHRYMYTSMNIKSKSRYILKIIEFDKYLYTEKFNVYILYIALWISHKEWYDCLLTLYYCSILYISRVYTEHLEIRALGVQNVIFYTRRKNFFLHQNCVRQTGFVERQIEVNENKRSYLCDAKPVRARHLFVYLKTKTKVVCFASNIYNNKHSALYNYV